MSDATAWTLGFMYTPIVLTWLWMLYKVDK